MVRQSNRKQHKEYGRPGRNSPSPKLGKKPCRDDYVIQSRLGQRKRRLFVTSVLATGLLTGLNMIKNRSQYQGRQVLPAKSESATVTALQARSRYIGAPIAPQPACFWRRFLPSCLFSSTTPACVPIRRAESKMLSCHANGSTAGEIRDIVVTSSQSRAFFTARFRSGAGVQTIIVSDAPAKDLCRKVYLQAAMASGRSLNIAKAGRRKARVLSSRFHH